MRKQHREWRTEKNANGALGAFGQGVKDCAPTLLGYWSIGFAAGVIGTTAGLSVMEIFLMCVLIYAGSAQFIMAGMVAAQAAASSIVLTIFFVNLRHLLMSAALSPYFRHLTPLKNGAIGALLTDETFGVAMSKHANKRSIDEWWMHGLNVTAYLNWMIANVAGAVFGQWIASPETFGLDFALPAMFIGLLAMQMMSRQKIKTDLIVALCAAALVVVASMYVSGSAGVIFATIIASTIGMAVEKWK